MTPREIVPLPSNGTVGALCFYNEYPDGWKFAIRNWNWQGLRDPSVSKTYIRTSDAVGVLEIGWETTTIFLVHRPLP